MRTGWDGVEYKNDRELLLERGGSAGRSAEESYARATFAGMSVSEDSQPTSVCKHDPPCSELWSKLLENPAEVLMDRTREHWPKHLHRDSMEKSTAEWGFQASNEGARLLEYHLAYPLPIGFQCSRDGESRHSKLSWKRFQYATLRSQDTSLANPQTHAPLGGKEQALWAVSVEDNGARLDLFGLADYPPQRYWSNLPKRMPVLLEYKPPYVVLDLPSSEEDLEEKENALNAPTINEGLSEQQLLLSGWESLKAGPFTKAVIGPILLRVPGEFPIQYKYREPRYDPNYVLVVPGSLAIALSDTDNEFLSRVADRAKTWWNQFRGNVLNPPYRPKGAGLKHWPTTDDFIKDVQQAMSDLSLSNKKPSLERIAEGIAVKRKCDPKTVTRYWEKLKSEVMDKNGTWENFVEVLEGSRTRST